MCSFSTSKLFIVWILIAYVEFGSPQVIRQFFRPVHRFPAGRVLPITCTQNTLMFYQDCRLCVCLRPNRVAKCYRKSCDLRTKDSGQCPMAVLKIEDGAQCSTNHAKGCRIDTDCPGAQLCCFDFCTGSRCINPVPLDILTGQQVHKGRGYD